MTPCFAIIQSAVDAAASGSTVRIGQGTYQETVTLNQTKNVILQGGWDDLFTYQTVNTTFMKPPKVMKGSLKLEMITLKTNFLYVSLDGTCGGMTPCFAIIQSAVDAAASGSTVRIGQGTFTGSIVLDQSKTVILDGGWNKRFTKQTAGTTFIKPPKVTKGTIKMEMISIKP